MNRPTLDESLRALRDDVRPPSDGGEATRQRVLHSAGAAAPSGMQLTFARRLLVLGVVAAAVITHLLAGRAHVPPAPAARSVHVPSAALPSAAPAPSSPALVTPLAQPLAHSPAPSQEQAGPTREAAQRASERRRPRRSLKPDHVGATSAAADAAPEVVGVSSPAPAAQKSSPVAAAASQPMPDAQLRALYMTAHRLHFRGDPAHALAAWDAYLRHAYEGPLTAEARFNRALTLLRLGRTDEARQELAIFAAGKYGQFRKADAQRLLAMPPSTSGF